MAQRLIRLVFREIFFTPRPHLIAAHIVLGATLLLLGCNDGDNNESPTDDPHDTETDSDQDTNAEMPDIGNRAFNPEAVLTYRIAMDPDLYTEMEEEGDDEEYRKAGLTIEGDEVDETFDEIGIRYKGDYSLHHCWDENGGVRNYSGECAKLNIKLKFSEYDKEGRFDGLKRINLHAMSEDDTKLRERLAYSIFNDFGVKTARCAHAQLIINDNAPMLVLAIEQIDGRFTASRFPNGGDGNLYKETWPHADLNEDELVEQLRTNDNPEDNPDVSHFIEFGEVVADATEESFLDDMAEFIDIEELLRYMAVDRAIKNWDGITAFYWRERPHNLFWYHDVEQSGLFHIIPWDHDKVLWENDPYMDPVGYPWQPVPDWNVKPQSCSPVSVWYNSVYVYPPGCDNFMNLLAATSWDPFVDIGESLIDTAMDLDTLNEKVTTWAEQIAPLVEADPLLYTSSWESSVSDLKQILEKSIDDFDAHLAQGYVVE